MAAETETNEPQSYKIKIGDEEYDIPLLDDFDMAEWQILWDFAGLCQEDFAPEVDCAEEDIETAAAEDLAAKGETEDEKTDRLALREKMLRSKDGPLEKARRRRIQTPAFTTARLHIGYRRMHPDTPEAEIRELVNGVKRARYYEAMFDTVLEGNDANDPPAETPALEQSSQAEQGKKSDPESNGSPESLAGRDVLAERIGTSG